MSASAADVAAVLRDWRPRQKYPEHLMLPERVDILAYFSQAYHLARHAEPLFTEEILAGPWGPVVNAETADGPAVGRLAMDPDGFLLQWIPGDAGNLTPAQQALVLELASQFGDKLSLELRAEAKSQTPWQRADAARTAEDPFPVISRRDMANYFRALFDAPTPGEYASRFLDRYDEIGAHHD